MTLSTIILDWLGKGDIIRRVMKTLNNYVEILTERYEGDIKVIVTLGKILEGIPPLGNIQNISPVTLLIVINSTSPSEGMEELSQEVLEKQEYEFVISPLVLTWDDFKEDLEDKKRFRKQVREGKIIEGKELLEDLNI